MKALQSSTPGLLHMIQLILKVYCIYIYIYIIMIILTHWSTRTARCGRWYAEGWCVGGGPLDGRLLGDVGGPRWSVGRWWAI